MYIGGHTFGLLTKMPLLAQNVYQQEFDSKLLAEISTMPSAFNILARDFNCVVDPEVGLIRTTPSKTVVLKPFPSFDTLGRGKPVPHCLNKMVLKQAKFKKLKY